jgi:uncharacterized protein with WD repeat
VSSHHCSRNQDFGLITHVAYSAINTNSNVVIIQNADNHIIIYDIGDTECPIAVLDNHNTLAANTTAGILPHGDRTEDRANNSSTA